MIMRALAEFIMRGRVQAAAVALIGSWLPLISPATVALVSLRLGATEGTLVLLWSLIPPIVGIALGQSPVTMVAITVAGLALALMMALLLRTTISWSRTLTGLVATGALIGLMVPVLTGDIVEQLNQMVAQLYAESGQSPEFQWTQASATGAIAYVLAMNALLSLLLARWWQSLLYNPGGFQSEFHQLQLQPVQAIVALAAAVYCLSQGNDYRLWAMLFATPLLIAGVAVAHRVVALKQFPGAVLALFYISLMVLPEWVILMAFVDVWINFRARLSQRS